MGTLLVALEIINYEFYGTIKILPYVVQKKVSTYARIIYS